MSPRNSIYSACAARPTCHGPSLLAPFLERSGWSSNVNSTLIGRCCSPLCKFFTVTMGYWKALYFCQNGVLLMFNHTQLASYVTQTSRYERRGSKLWNCLCVVFWNVPDANFLFGVTWSTWTWCKPGARSLTIDPACIYLSIGATCRFWDTCVVARAVKTQGLTLSGSDLLRHLGPGNDINLWPTSQAVLLLSGTWWDSEVSLNGWTRKAERSGRLEISWNCERSCLKPCKSPDIFYRS